MPKKNEQNKNEVYKTECPDYEEVYIDQIQINLNDFTINIP